MPLVRQICPCRAARKATERKFHRANMFTHLTFKYGKSNQTKPILTVPHLMGCFINNSRVDTSSALPVIPPLQHHFNQPHLIYLLSAASQQHLWKRFCSTEKYMHRKKDTVLLLPLITLKVLAKQLSQTLFRQLIARHCDAFNTFKKVRDLFIHKL